MSKIYHKTVCENIRYHQIEEATRRVTDSEESVRMKCAVKLGNGRKFHITATAYWPVVESEYDYNSPRWTFDACGIECHSETKYFWFTEDYWEASKIIGDKLHADDWTIHYVLSHISDDIYYIRALWRDNKVTGTYRFNRDGLKVYKV